MKNNFFTTSYNSKEILKRKYSVNYKTSVLLLLIIVPKKSLENFSKMVPVCTFSGNRPYYFSLQKRPEKMKKARAVLQYESI